MNPNTIDRENLNNDRAQNKIQDANNHKTGDSLARAEANRSSLGSRIPSGGSSIESGNPAFNHASGRNVLADKRNQARVNSDQKIQGLKRKAEEDALKKLGSTYGIPETVSDKLIKSNKGQRLLDMIDQKQSMNPFKNKGLFSKLSGDSKKEKENKDALAGKDIEKSAGQEAMDGSFKVSLKVIRMALFFGPLSAIIILTTVLIVAAINDDKVSSMILAGASADEAKYIKEELGKGSSTTVTGKGNKYPEDYYKRLANLGNNYSSQKKCEGSECLSTSEFMYYLKIADIKTRYEKKYGVSLDWYLISATNLYKTETTEETMTANLGGYDTKSVDNLNTVSGLDWENDYKNISGYVYLDRDDSTYDLQILAKNMVTKKTIQKCVTSSGTVTSKQEDTDVEDVYLNSTKKLKCSSNETYIINSTYTKDEEKFKEFMLEYIDLKMYSNGSGNKGNHQSSCSVTTDGSYLWPIGSVETTTGKDGKTYALGTPEYGKENISRGYANGHQGLDIHSSSRINVVNVIASKSGTVVYPTSLSQTGYADVGNSSDGGGYGNYVKIQHDDGSYTLYGHMAKDSITVVAGDKVDIQGTSKGKGFQGVIKRHGQSRGPMGHGSMYHRRPGSMGPTSTPGRVFKGKKLPGHMGHVTVTIQNLDVVAVDLDKNLILVKGSVPGAKGAILKIKSSVKA